VFVALGGDGAAGTGGDPWMLERVFFVLEDGAGLQAKGNDNGNRRFPSGMTSCEELTRVFMKS
jgi:hypothetical protein